MIGSAAKNGHFVVTVQVSLFNVVRSVQLCVVSGCGFGGKVSVGKSTEIDSAAAGAAAESVRAVRAARVMRFMAFSFVGCFIRIPYFRIILIIEVYHDPRFCQPSPL